MQTGLDGQVVLVTGASGGIGQATARAFAAEGARLVLHAFRNLDAAERLAGELACESVAIGADLRDEAAVDGLFADAISRVGQVDSIVVNAGLWVEEDVPLHRMSLGQWRETFETDLTSAFLTCRAFMRHLEAAPRDVASIVLVASTAAIFGEAGHADYASAKAAMAYGLTRTLKNEIVKLAPRGRVNCVCPGWTRTPMTEGHLRDEALVQRVTATMPMKKVATADDVARAIAYLASDHLAGHVTGSIVPVAGGMEGRLQ